ncbi:hypothetical protein [Rhizobium laguerreae]|uniref:hypothetical protein n=1 Tax=Rhizobium laguerreae TaxID=1076926 RepID=UPI001C90EB25|nr:hypothetical protein [Rhizobium laguerreae]MBY3434826.1 hypothetical protein [Rhizobium laguerreae]MBY3448969.1 hypothetical protein [Rhizobium laguerreae]MBY3456743.1 hypothetical protein [Rhizobium laguerreae]
MPVSARFHDLRNKVLASVDDKFAEPVTLMFMKNGVNDPARQMVTIDAVLRVGEGKNTSVAGGIAAAWRTRIVADKAQLHIDRATYTGPQPKAGDKVKAISRHGEPFFEVADVDDRGHTRLVLNLNEV